MVRTVKTLCKELRSVIVNNFDCFDVRPAVYSKSAGLLFIAINPTIVGLYFELLRKLYYNILLAYRYSKNSNSLGNRTRDLSVMCLLP